jgi:RNA polymerase sigma-70 factor (ECF subfamily)
MAETDKDEADGGLEPDDYALMEAVRAGDERAFAALVERYQRPLLNFFARMGATANDDDLAQETFVKVWKYRAKYKPSAKFTTFLYTLARHALLDHFRMQGRFASFAVRYAEEAPAGTDGGHRALHEEMDIQTALGTLPQGQREVLALAVHRGQTYEEIARTLSIPLGTVKSRVFNALRSIQERFRDEP